MYLLIKKKKNLINNCKRSFTFVLFVLITMYMSAQRVPQYTQYMYNTISLNPAYVGNKGGMTILGLHRNQWAGSESSPKTYMFSLNSAIREDTMNVGLSIVNDQFGFTNDTYINLDYSYSIYVTNRNKLSFGLKGGIVNRNNNLGNLNPFQENDPAFEDGLGSQIKPSFGLGAYYNSDEFYVGVSALNILQNYQLNTNVLEDSEPIAQQITSYLIMGYVFEVHDSFKIKPTTLVKYTSGVPLQIDISLNTLIHDKFIVGAAYRHKAAVSGMFGFHINYYTLLGLSYDRDITKLSKLDGNYGSLELFLKFNLFNYEKRYLPPRFF